MMHITDVAFQIHSPIALPIDEVQLWRIDLEAIRSDQSRWQKLLSQDEAARASRFHFLHDRQRFVTSRAVLRIILAGYLAIEPPGILFSYSKKEKPSLAATHADSGVTFNVSHSGGIALFAFARSREIGIDVERVRRDFDIAAIARRFFSAHEQAQLSALASDERIDAFFRCWTRKECYIKAIGEGLSLPLHEFDVSLANDADDALLATRPDASEAALWRLQNVPAGAGYLAALCVRGREWRLKDWSKKS